MTKLASTLILLTIWLGLPNLSTGQYVSPQASKIRGDMAPGVAADMSRMADRRLENHLQPVRILVPDQTMIEVAVGSGFTKVNSSRVSLGMFIGPVYRFKITNIGLSFDKELYPSIEVLGKLNPPAGMDNDFPIEVKITEDDLQQALGGNLVTKVIYLENPRNALPHKHLRDQQPVFDVGQREDPVDAAKQLGRPMAILRIGSRVPLANDVAAFNFYAPEPKFLPEPQPTQFNPDWVEPFEIEPLRLPQKRFQQPYRSTDWGPVGGQPGSLRQAALPQQQVVPVRPAVDPSSRNPNLRR